MRKVLAIVVVLSCWGVLAASARWNGIGLSNAGWYANGSREYHFSSDIYGANGQYAWVHSYFYGRAGDDGLSLKHFDFSHESMDPTYNWWVLAAYGDFVSEATFDSLARIEDFYSTDPNAPFTDGTKVENPSDFYMAFKASEVLLSGHEYVEGRSWYGWVHVSVDEDMEMTLLGEGINLSGGGVTVGAIPEPAAGLLVVVGAALLVLRRRGSLCRHTFTSRPPAKLKREKGKNVLMFYQDMESRIHCAVNSRSWVLALPYYLCYNSNVPCVVDLISGDWSLKPQAYVPADRWSSCL